jgi:hypothetical protein
MVRTKLEMVEAVAQVAVAGKPVTAATAVLAMLAVVVVALAPAMALLPQTQLDVFLVASIQLIILMAIQLHMAVPLAMGRQADQVMLC